MLATRWVRLLKGYKYSLMNFFFKSTFAPQQAPSTKAEVRVVFGPMGFRLHVVEAAGRERRKEGAYGLVSVPHESRSTHALCT